MPSPLEVSPCSIWLGAWHRVSPQEIITLLSLYHVHVLLTRTGGHAAGGQENSLWGPRAPGLEFQAHQISQSRCISELLCAGGSRGECQHRSLGTLRGIRSGSPARSQRELCLSPGQGGLVGHTVPCARVRVPPVSRAAGHLHGDRRPQRLAPQAPRAAGRRQAVPASRPCPRVTSPPAPPA